MNRISRFARYAALGAIRAYQRWLSPHKGFCCALRAATGAEGCSAYGHRVIARFGLRRGLGLLDRRLALCGQIHRHLAPPSAARPMPVPDSSVRHPAVRHPLLGRQGGFCDLPSCDCDLPGCDSHARGAANGVCDALDCAGDVADCLPERWRRRRQPPDAGRERIAALAERIRRNRARRRLNDADD